ncbi:ornithine cyclodeaminase family protein [Oceanobacillus polygoni]|uniref:Ornithine cyclodeaminase n=1 Tax=Oceanobacillus polygoni TaxID=1235259 RepID=A0A9X0YVM6_9BACI|nr:ornithine cyclodeaminase family protein [Oceanobacillus polygoni]MBP2079252.1 ornithine cyclodeaminase [Oceanobacillus polygoni]
MLFLNENDIKKAVTINDVIDAVDSAYRLYEANQFQMPLRMHVSEKENTLLLMPCFTAGAIGTKLVTLFPNNKHVPMLQGIVILNSSETGEVKGILEGSFLTGLRTGAVGGSAVRHLARKDATKLSIIGTGVQGLYQAVAACSQRPITDIYLYNRSPEKLPEFIAQLENWIETTVHLHPMDTVEEAIKNVDIIITSTSSNDPVLPNKKHLLRNKLVIGVGSYQPSMQEFPEALYELTDTILVDTEHAIDESGDLINPLAQGLIKPSSVQKMSTYILSEPKPSLGNTTVFKSTGMALFDVVVANTIYQKAMDKGVGTILSL